MISTDEAAELTGATRATINAWIKKIREEAKVSQPIFGPC
jgi:DNA-binding transcriptional regulator YiaG